MIPARIVLTGGAGLVGQNLIVELLNGADTPEIIAIDKNWHNLALLGKRHPAVTLCHADLAVPGAWRDHLAGADAVVILHAQISATDPAEFERNNITATEAVLNAIDDLCPDARVVHVSSSVVNSSAEDAYVASKVEQETLIRNRLPNAIILRPTLMFGWFDRKHLGWLSRFMRSSPVFPIPGDGQYIRQPLYVRDFCRIVLACLRYPEHQGQSLEISGLEPIAYIDLIKLVRSAVGTRCVIIHLPYRVFHLLLKIYAWFDHDPPFTTDQLAALVIPEVFESAPWPKMFDVTPTDLRQAVDETWQHPVYSAERPVF